MPQSMPAQPNEPTIPPSSHPVAAKPKSRLRRLFGSQFWGILLTTVVLGLILFAIIFFTGYVEGEEFAPTHFRTRKFTFYEIPLIGWQITPIHRTSTTPETSLFLTQKKYVTAPKLVPSTWHLVDISRGRNESINNDAALLVNQLRFSTDGQPTWKKWSKDHPKLASELWPIIGKLAQRELYLLIPRLFELVRDIDDVQSMRQVTNEYLSREYSAIISDMKAAGRDDLAAELQREATEDDWLTPTSITETKQPSTQTPPAAP